MKATPYWITLILYNKWPVQYNLILNKQYNKHSWFILIWQYATADFQLLYVPD